MRRKSFLLVLVTAAAVLMPATVGRAGGAFHFYGSGFGHGLGMSQWGAYGMAQDKWTHRQILRRFYSGTQVGQANNPPEQIRVGLVSGATKFTLTAQSGKVDLKVGNHKTGEVAGTIPNGDTWTVRASDDNSYKILNEAGKRVGGRTWGGPNTDLFAVYATHSARVRIPAAGGTYNRGYVEFNLYSCSGGCSERLVLVIPPQPYLYGIAEVPSSWPMDALQAQVDAARTYAFKTVESGQHKDPCNCALYDDSRSQVYVGWAKESGVGGDRWVSAVRQTDGQVVTFNGDLISAFYSSSSGGHTEDKENVWGDPPIGYLKGVCDPGDYTSANPSRIWEVDMSADTVTSRLGLGIGTVTGFSNIQRGVSGRIISMRVDGKSGSASISGTTFRLRLGLRDDRVWINSDKNVVGAIRHKYDGIDCAPGLPTSERVDLPGGVRQAFDVGGIVRNNGAKLTVWLKGPPYEKWLSEGGGKGFLGLPTSAAKDLTEPSGCGPAATCTRVRFEGGTIYFKEGVGAHELHGPVLGYYTGHGGPAGSLGFPTSDVQTGGDGSTSATFENGTVTCASGGSCSQS